MKSARTPHLGEPGTASEGLGCADGIDTAPVALSAVRFPLGRPLALAFFWVWALLWTSNCPNADWPVSSPDTFGPTRIVWLIAYLMSCVLIESLSRHGLLTNRHRILALVTPIGALGTLAVFLLPGETRTELLVLTVASALAGFAAAGFMPMWSASYNTRSPERVGLMMWITAFGAIALLLLIVSMPNWASRAIFVALPLLSGIISFRDKEESPFVYVLEDVRPSVSRKRLKLGYTAVVIIACFMSALSVLEYQSYLGPVSRGLTLLGAGLAVLICVGLCAVSRRQSIGVGYYSAILLPFFGLLALAYFGTGHGSVVQMAVGSGILCWGMLAALGISRIESRLRLKRQTIVAGSETVLAVFGVPAIVLGYWLSHSVTLDQTLVTVVSLGAAYLLLTATTFLISTAVVSESRQKATIEGSALESACTGMAATHGLTRREEEVLKMLATGRSRSYIRKELSIAEGTVNAHIHHVHQKLNVHSRDEILDLVERCGRR